MSVSLEVQLQQEVMLYEHDPLGFVRAVWPWGEGELHDSDGPREWQQRVLSDVGARLRAGMEPGAALMPVLKAVASGHGIGKSALVSWLIWWALSTCPDAKVVITANTQDQLRTKTWPEVAKWARLACNAHWFEVQGLSIVSRDKSHAKTWRCDAVTWSETNLEAFAGLHNKGRRILLMFDEASGIHEKVWEVAEGALTDEDTEIVWIAFGNPTDPAGRFFECFNRQAERWRGEQIDSRTVPGTNKALFAEWVALYGEDSDFCRVRVRGQFPRAGSMQLISSEDVEEASKREAVALLSDAFVIGVDVARFGSDASVIYFRKGRDGRTHPPIILRGVDTMQLAGRVAEEYTRYRADAIFVDGGGVGGGVIDRLRQLRVPVIEVQFGGKADRVSMTEERHGAAQKRTELWLNMRDWLKHGAIPDDPDLHKELTSPQYSFVIREGRDVIQLEPKEAMKKRGLSSPDQADALALTFAYPVMPNTFSGGVGARPRVEVDYNPFANPFG
jgi:hypothetical protein